MPWSVVNANDQIDISLSQNTKAKNIRIHKYPRWFYLTLFGMIAVTSTIMFVQVLKYFQPAPPVLGPKFEGYDHEELVDIDAPVEASVLAGLQAPFEDFVMRINADKMEDVGVRISGLSSNPKLWDQRLFNAVANQIKKTSSWTGFWKRLELVKDDYALVVDSLREADLPEVLAGITISGNAVQRNTSVCGLCRRDLAVYAGNGIQNGSQSQRLQNGSNWETVESNRKVSTIFCEERCRVCDCQCKGRAQLSESVPTLRGHIVEWMTASIQKHQRLQR